ncbi:hypothetical protein DFH09DRAFT_1103234 [Mycena vulgaris]|nr:hypothetical protein DFH09DRAFT_1103234 [Mycena vulgaris]
MPEKIEHSRSISPPERLELETSCSSFSTGALSPEARAVVRSVVEGSTRTRTRKWEDASKFLPHIVQNALRKEYTETGRWESYPRLERESACQNTLPHPYRDCQTSPTQQRIDPGEHGGRLNTSSRSGWGALNRRVARTPGGEGERSVVPVQPSVSQCCQLSPHPLLAPPSLHRSVGLALHRPHPVHEADSH